MEKEFKIIKTKKEHKIGEKLVSKKYKCFYDVEGELIDVNAGDVLSINDIMDYYNGEISHFLVLLNNSTIEVRMTEEDINEITK